MLVHQRVDIPGRPRKNAIEILGKLPHHLYVHPFVGGTFEYLGTLSVFEWMNS
jgi:hypothetical protein